MKVEFSSNPLIVGKSITEPTINDIKQCRGLWHADLSQAGFLGGPLTAAALKEAPLLRTRDYITVDTKIHMLKPQMMPAIPGWHTDGVPRGKELDPAGGGAPNLRAQIQIQHDYDMGIQDRRPPIYHLLVTGEGCRTIFLDEPIALDLPDTEFIPDLYSLVSQEINDNLEGLEFSEIPQSTWVTWDWWNLHTAQKATVPEWRFLIRVTESDDIAPEYDLSKCVRLQEQVYIETTNFGW